VGGQPGAAGHYACAGRNMLGGAGPAWRGGAVRGGRARLRACAGRDVRVGRALSGGSTGLRAWARRHLWGVASGPSRAARMRGAGWAVVADVGAIRGAERGCALRDAVGPVVPDAGGGVHRGAGAVGHPRAGRALQPAEPSYRALRGWPGGVAGTGCREGRLGGGGLGRAGGPLSWRGGRCLGCARCWKPKETRRAARHEQLQLGLGSLASVRDPRRNAGRSQGGAVGNGVPLGEPQPPRWAETLRPRQLRKTQSPKIGTARENSPAARGRWHSRGPRPLLSAGSTGGGDAGVTLRGAAPAGTERAFRGVTVSRLLQGKLFDSTITDEATWTLGNNRPVKGSLEGGGVSQPVL